MRAALMAVIATALSVVSCPAHATPLAHLTRTIPLGNAECGCQLARGPDGRVWAVTGHGIVFATNGRTLHRYPVPAPHRASAIAIGGDGALWLGADELVVRMTTAGSTTPFALRGVDSDIVGLAWWHDALWLADAGRAQDRYTGDPGAPSLLARLDPATGGFTTYRPNYDEGLLVDIGPEQILPTPTGLFYRTDHHVSSVSTDGAQRLLSPYIPGELTDMTLGTDGAIWLLAEFPSRILRLAPDGRRIHVWHLHTGAAQPQTIATGPDGALWVGMGGQPRDRYLLRITTRGHITRHASAQLRQIPRDIIAGPARSLWVIEQGFTERTYLVRLHVRS